LNPRFGARKVAVPTSFYGIVEYSGTTVNIEFTENVRIMFLVVNKYYALLVNLYPRGFGEIQSLNRT